MFVPRVLWPEKPIITKLSNEFNVAATGNPKSASGPGIFGEAYWNFGWSGLLIVIPYAVILSVLSLYSLRMVRAARWFYFPMVMYAMQIGFRVDGFFVSNVVGPCALLVAMHFLMVGIERGVLPLFRTAPVPRVYRPRRPPMPMPRVPLGNRTW